MPSTSNPTHMWKTHNPIEGQEISLSINTLFLHLQLQATWFGILVEVPFDFFKFPLGQNKIRMKTVPKRGGIPNDKPNLMTQDGFLTTLNDANTRDSPTQSFTSEDGIRNARNHTLGLSSAINISFYNQAGVNWREGIKRK